MGFNLDKAREKVLTGEVRYAGEPIKIQFKPGKLGKEWQQKFDEAQASSDSDGGIRGMIESMLEVLTDWDIETDLDALYAEAYPDESERNQHTGGRELGRGPVPLEMDLILAADLPIPLYGMITNQMLEDASDQSKKAKKG